MRVPKHFVGRERARLFPFLFGGTFIEGPKATPKNTVSGSFPFLFGGTFIEGSECFRVHGVNEGFPFLFGGTFIEGP